MSWNEILHETILPQLNAIFQVIVYIGVPTLSAFIIKWLKDFFNSLKKKTDNETIHNQIDRVSEAVIQSVNYVSQTYVDTLKKSGNFTWDSQIEAFNKTKSLAVSLISTESKKLIDEMYGDFDKWLNTKIESVISGK